MKFDRFEDLSAWKDAARLYVAVAEFTDDVAVRRKGDFANQLERAALSVSNNIAEGFELGTTDQLIRFLYIAKGSAGECRSMLTVALGVPHLAHARSKIQDLRAKAESIAKQLGAWCSHLQNSDLKGARHLTDATREQDARRKRVEGLLATMKGIVDEARRTKEFPAAPPESADQP